VKATVSDQTQAGPGDLPMRGRRRWILPILGAVILLYLTVTVVLGLVRSFGPAYAAPDTPQERAVAARIASFLKAVSAADPVAACRQVAPTARKDFRYRASAYITCAPRPFITERHNIDPDGWRAPVYNVEIDGTTAKAVIPDDASAGDSSGQEFTLTQVEGRWLLTETHTYIYTHG
jgi:hypothetical protein